MIILKGKNLSERHKELNFKVIKAAKNKHDLQQVKCAEDSDLDRIFKVELASKYKNVDYVLEELKSSDSLYVSRALKCEWLYGIDYAHLINPDYLHHHIFPRMSLKMKTTTLKIMSIYVREETRSQLFYEYCMNTEQWAIAIKFLIFTSESFKNELLNDDSRFYNLSKRVKKDYFRKFIGNSFILADAYGNRARSITDLTYLFSLDEEKYLDLLEKHTMTASNAKVHGVKMSRSILKKHKDRILRKPLLYLTVLNRNELLKYSSSEDAKVYAVALLPDYHYFFWRRYFLLNPKPILNLIKTPSMFEFVKKIYIDKYEEQEFEMTKEFYEYKYYNLMTSEERETWAFSHMQKQLDVIPEEESYRWYEYIEFVKSFKGIKTQMYITTCPEKRLAMLTILVKSAKTQRDLEELFNYYYKRHVNETKDKKTKFVEAVMEYHNVLEFDDACWAALDLLLHSLDVYNPLKHWSYNDILTTSLVYHIINDKTVSKDLQIYLKHAYLSVSFNRYLDQNSKHYLNEKKDLFINYVKQFMISTISEFDARQYSDAVRCEIRRQLSRWEPFRCFLYENGMYQYPDIVLKYMNLDYPYFSIITGVRSKYAESETQLKITEAYLLRCLKEDPSVIVEKLPVIVDRFSKSHNFRINLLLRKIALYFSNDIAKQFLEFFTKTLYELLSNTAVVKDETINDRSIDSIVFAIFQMTDQKIKTELMDKFAPTYPKIEHAKIGRFVLYTQQAICRFQSYSRPPVPLSKTALYLKGDYVHYCDYMFNMYLTNLPPALRTEFIKLMLDAPLSVQKRGLRLAFKIFEANELNDLVSSVWKKTKNVSLRQILYLLLISKLVKEEEVWYGLLKELTLSIHQDDTDKVFACFSGSQIPENFRGAYLQIAWKVVTELPEKKSNLKRKTRVIQSFVANMYLINEDFLVSLIYDHVDKILCDQKLRPEVNNDIAEQNEAMWELTAQYIVDVSNEEKQEKSLKLVNVITNECLSNWNEDHNTKHLIFQTFFNNFVKRLLRGSSYFGTEYLRLIHIFEYFLQTFENKFGIPKMYSYFWDWKLDLLMRKVIDGKPRCDKAVCINFGLALGVLIKELKDNNLYYISFSDKIFGKISGFVHHLNSMKEKTLDCVDVPVLVAYGLTLTNIFESYVLALNILPANPNEVISNEYLEVLKKIKEKNNEEITAFINDKFVYEDLKVRKFTY